MRLDVTDQADHAAASAFLEEKFGRLTDVATSYIGPLHSIDVPFRLGFYVVKDVSEGEGVDGEEYLLSVSAVTGFSSSAGSPAP